MRVGLKGNKCSNSISLKNYPEDRPSTSKMGIDNYGNDEDSEVLQRDSKIQKELQVNFLKKNLKYSKIKR